MERRLTTDCTINLIINRQRIKKDGTCRLYISISVKNENPIKIPLPLHWSAQHYDVKSHSILPRQSDDPDYDEFMATIETEKAKYWKVVKKFYLSDKHFKAVDIVKGVNIINIGKTISQYITARSRERLRKKEIKDHTRNTHLSAANRLLEHFPNDVEIMDISEIWLNNYFKRLLKKLAYGGAWTHLKTICAYVRDAKEHNIEINETFEFFKLEGCDSDPVWLEQGELEKLLDLYNDPNFDYNHKNCLRGFLFACFTGLRISDLKRFRTSWIVGEEIVFTPVKGKITAKKPSIVHIPIIGAARQFLSSLDGGRLVDESEQKLNKRLKTIAGIAGISKHITHHVARHTFGTLLAVASIPVVVISKLMGHKKTSTTMVYIHIAENIRQTEMNKLQMAFSNFVVKQPIKTDYTKTPVIN